MSDQDNKFYIATNSRVACLDKASGEILWQTELGGHLHYGSLLVDDDWIYAAGHKRAACLNRASGALRWQTVLKGLSSPTSIALDKTVPGGQIVLACNGLLFALWAETGELLWNNELEGWGYDHICLRVPGAISALPRHHLVSTGKSSYSVVTEDLQGEG
jgi:outer membrane protein assembly factor BamB